MYILAIDNAIAEKMLSARSETLAKIMSYLTLLGNAEIIIALTIILIYLFWQNKQKLYSHKLIITTTAAGMLSWLIKHFIHRARPLGGFVVENSFSFPSGHATLSMALYGFCVYYIWENTTDKNKKIFFLILSSLLILLIGFTRLYLGVHYLSDVLGGYILGLLCLAVGIKAVKSK